VYSALRKHLPLKVATICECYGTLKKNDTDIQKHFSSANRKASSENWKVSSEEVEFFFRRALGSCTHKFPKCGAALLELHLSLPELCLCLPELRLFLPELCLCLPELRLCLLELCLCLPSCVCVFRAVFLTAKSERFPQMSFIF